MKQKITKLYLESEYDEMSRNTLVELLVPRFFSFFKNLGAESHDAEDYCQELFIILFKSRASFDPERSFLPWAYMIARNLYIRENSRKGRVNIISLQEWMEDTNKSAAQGSFEAASDNQSFLESLLDSLSADKRKVLVLKHFHGMKFSEIASVLNISEGTVKTRAFYALRELKEKARGKYNE